MLKNFFFFLIVAFITSCNQSKIQKLSNYTLQDSTKVDEVSFIIQDVPHKIEIIDDSICIVITGDNDIAIYNYHTGKLTKKLRTKILESDSTFNDIVSKYKFRNGTIILSNKGIKQRINFDLPTYIIENCQYNSNNNAIILACSYKIGIQDSHGLGVSDLPFFATVDINSEDISLIPFNDTIVQYQNFNPSPYSGFYFFNDKMYVNNYVTRKPNNASTILEFKSEAGSLAFVDSLPILYPNNLYRNWVFRSSFDTLDNSLYASNQKSIFKIGKQTEVAYKKLINDTIHDQVTNFTFFGYGGKNFIGMHVVHIDTLKLDYFDNYLNVYDLNTNEFASIMISTKNAFPIIDLYKNIAIAIVKVGEHYYFKKFVFKNENLN